MRHRTEKRFSPCYQIIFNAECDSVINSYQWKRPLTESSGVYTQCRPSQCGPETENSEAKPKPIFLFQNQLLYFHFYQNF